MGLNMPARTCVFTSMQKWDGTSHRWMTSGEYIQMSGRAGRRGKDDRGVCIMMVDAQMDKDTCRCAAPRPPLPRLESFFRVCLRFIDGLFGVRALACNRASRKNVKPTESLGEAPSEAPQIRTF